jgi:hypothetical protein
MASGVGGGFFGASGIPDLAICRGLIGYGILLQGLHSSTPKANRKPVNERCDDEPIGTWSVWRRNRAGQPVLIEGSLTEEIARDIVADYWTEGVEVWAEEFKPLPTRKPWLLFPLLVPMALVEFVRRIAALMSMPFFAVFPDKHPRRPERRLWSSGPIPQSVLSTR